MVARFEIGEKVHWISQAGGRKKEKRGIVRAIVKMGDDPKSHIPAEVARTRIKFDSLYPVLSERIIVEVQRFGKNGKQLASDWHSPHLGVVRREGE